MMMCASFISQPHSMVPCILLVTALLQHVAATIHVEVQSTHIKEPVFVSWGNLTDGASEDWWSVYNATVMLENGLENVGAGAASWSNLFSEPPEFASDGTLWSYISGSQTYEYEYENEAAADSGSASFFIDRPGSFFFVYFCCDTNSVVFARNFTVEAPPWPIFSVVANEIMPSVEIEVNFPTNGSAILVPGMDWLWALDADSLEGGLTVETVAQMFPPGSYSCGLECEELSQAEECTPVNSPSLIVV